MVTQDSKNVRNLILGVLIILAGFYTIFPPLRESLNIFGVMLIISFIAYNAKEYQEELEGINLKKGWLNMVALGASAGAIFVVVTSLVPGLSFAYPLLPNAISDTFKFILVVFFAPIVEEVFFNGVVLAFFKNLWPKRKWTNITLKSIAFASFHAGAFVAGFYLLPDLATGISQLLAVTGSFTVAFIYGMISGHFIWSKKNNLMFTIPFHMIINLLVFSLSVVTFVVVMALL